MTLSYCTVCMNRLDHLRVTLPKNLHENEQFPNVSFLILDYNSQDGLEEWLTTELSQYLEKGTLLYYKTTEPLSFDRSHSRNMAFRLASTDLICNVDCDNFVLASYTDYVLRQFQADKNIFIAVGVGDGKMKRDVVGRICCNKSDFEMIRGFDEKMIGYGFEDNDFANRLLAHGRTKVLVTNSALFDAISHDDSLRINNEKMFKLLQNIYISTEDVDQKHFLIMLKDNTFVVGSVKENVVSEEPVVYSLREAFHGEWTLAGRSHLRFRTDATGEFAAELFDDGRQIQLSIFDFRLNRIDSEAMRQSALLIFMMANNQKVCHENISVQQRINATGYGIGTAWRLYSCQAD